MAPGFLRTPKTLGVAASRGTLCSAAWPGAGTATQCVGRGDEQSCVIHTPGRCGFSQSGPGLAGASCSSGVCLGGRGLQECGTTPPLPQEAQRGLGVGLRSQSPGAFDGNSPSHPLLGWETRGLLSCLSPRPVSVTEPPVLSRGTRTNPASGHQAPFRKTRGECGNGKWNARPVTFVLCSQTRVCTSCTQVCLHTHGA